MKNYKKKSNLIVGLFLIIIIFFIIAQVTIILAEEGSSEGTESSAQKTFKFKEQKNVKIAKLDNGGRKVIFEKEGYVVDSRGNKFEGIQKDGEVIFDNNGNVISANFKVDKDKKEYVFGNDKFEVPAGGSVEKKENIQVVKIDVPRGSSVKVPSLADEKIDVKPNIITFNSEGVSEFLIERKQDGRKVSFEGSISTEHNKEDNGIYVFVNKGDSFKSSGVSIKGVEGDSAKFRNDYELNNDKTYLFFNQDKKPEGFKGNYLILDKDNKFIEGRSARVFLEPGNPFIPVKENTNFAIATKTGSAFRIKNTPGEKRPIKFSTYGDVVVDIGKKGFYIKGNKIFQSDKGTYLTHSSTTKNSASPAIDWIPYNTNQESLKEINGKGAKLIFNENNQVALVRQDADARVEINGKITGGQGSGGVGGVTSNVNNPKFRNMASSLRSNTGISGLDDIASRSGSGMNEYVTVTGPDGTQKIRLIDTDPMTAAHEGTHGINSHIKNKFGRGTGVDNAFYVGNGKYALLREPNIRLKNVIGYVPNELRGSRFGTYISGGVASQWDNEPLYILDEAVAYTNGGRVGVQMATAGKLKGGKQDGVGGAMEFVPYSLGLGMAVKNQDSRYWNGVEGAKFRSFMKYQLEQQMGVFQAGRKISQFQSSQQETLYNNLKSAREAENMRTFARQTFGSDWTRKVLGF
ncbi:MAG: hypothetical protein ABIH37_02390 [archaeon]